MPIPETADPYMAVPETLKGLARQAAEKAVEFIRANHKAVFGQDKEPNTGGCKMFYTPEEWKERRELYGTESLVVVVHDGGDHAAYFNWDYECYKLIESLGEELAKIGCFAEQCTCWYSAIYKS